jgi:phage shock protein C
VSGEEKTLLRPRDGRVVAGVCAAVARRFGLDAVVVRAVWVLAVLVLGVGILAYLILWVLIPEE